MVELGQFFQQGGGQEKNIELEKFTCEKFIIRGGGVIFFLQSSQVHEIVSKRYQ